MDDVGLCSWHSVTWCWKGSGDYTADTSSIAYPTALVASLDHGNHLCINARGGGPAPDAPVLTASVSVGLLCARQMFAASCLDRILFSVFQ